jgi:hypothetical protein
MTAKELILSMGWDYENTEMSARFVAEHAVKTMYSEEEVIELLQKALTHKDDGETGSLVTAQGEIRTANFFSWFEQFKKK